MKLKRILSLVLALAMVLGTMGTVAFAEDNVTVIGAGTYTKEQFSDYIKDGATLKAAEGATVEFKMEGAKPNFNGASMTFDGITFTWSNENYTGLQHSGDLVYNNCIINGQPFLYGTSETFNTCTFNQTSSDAYNVWTYSAKYVEFNSCTFNSAGKSVLVYNEGAGATTVDVKACEFIARETVDDKAAIEMHTLGGDITVKIDDDTSATGFGTNTVSGNSLWNDKTSIKEGNKNDAMVTVGDEVVWAYVGKGTEYTPAVAFVGGVPYATLKEAINAAQAGDTVIIKEGTYAVPSMKAGITLVGEGEVLLEGTLSGTLEDLTLENLHIKGDNAQRWAYAKGNLKFKNVTFEATSVYALHFDGITAGANLLYEDCTIIGWVAMSGSPESCVFDGCTIKDNGSYGVIRTYFDAEIKDCTFDVDEANQNDVYQDGIHAVGATIKVENCTNTNGTMEDILNISNDAFIYVDDVLVLAPSKEYKVDTQTAFEEALASTGDVVIDLNADVTLNVSDAYIKLGTDKTKSITINGNGHRLDLTTSYWSRLNIANENAKLILNDITVDSSQESGTWNSYDVTFLCPVELNNVNFEKAVALENDAKLTNVSITETHDYYALWISANGQNVLIDGLTINSNGRGIKIDDQYCNENTAKVELSIKNSDINSKNKAAILVKSSEGATITAENVDIKDVVADSENLVWIDEDGAIYQEKVTVNGKRAFVENQCIILSFEDENRDDMHFAFLADAINCAQAGDTIKLFSSLEEEVVIEAPAVAVLALNDEAIVIDFNGYTLDGSILIKDATKNIKIKNGNILNGNKDVSAIEINAGTLVLDDMNIESERHAVRLDGLVNATINSGTYKVLVNNKLTTHAVNASGGAEVTINGGTFYGPKGTPYGSAAGGSAINIQANTSATINGGYFAGGVNNTLSGDAIVVKSGLFDQDPTAYIDKDVVVEESAVEGYAYMVAPKSATEIDVEFEAGTNKGEYIVKLVGADEKKIWEFTSAELIIKNESVSLDGAIGTLPYEIVPAANLTVTKGLEGKDNYDGDGYAFALNKDPNVKANRITDTEIKLGTIKFTSQGTPKLSVTYGTVVATRYNTNLPKYYSTDASLTSTGCTLDVSATLDGALVPDTTRDVVVNIDYNLGLVGGEWTDDEIEVTLVDSFGAEYTGKDNGDHTMFTFEDIKTGRITVKLFAPGFRTYTYDAILYETDKENNPLVLNFWNNVKTGEDEDPFEKIDESNEVEKKMAHNFVVGDIVMDFVVDRYDLAAVTSYYGMYDITGRTNASEKYLKYDLNRDGNIDIIDVHYVLHTFGN